MRNARQLKLTGVLLFADGEPCAVVGCMVTLSVCAFNREITHEDLWDMRFLGVADT